MVDRLERVERRTVGVGNATKPQVRAWVAMTKQYSCDFCGEPITDADPVTLSASGHTYDRDGDRIGYIYSPGVGHYHCTEDRPCWVEMLDRIQLIHAVSSDIGPNREAVERRIEQRAERQRKNEEHDERWRQHRERQAEWRSRRPETRETLLLNAFGDERLTIGEVANRINAELGCSPDAVPTLDPSDVRRLAMRLLDAGQLEREPETFRNKTRYRWHRKSEGRA